MKIQSTLLAFATALITNFAQAGLNPPETHECDRFETTNCTHESLQTAKNNTMLECTFKNGDGFRLNVKYLDDLSETSKTGCAKEVYSLGNPPSYYQVKFCKGDIVTGNVLNKNDEGKWVRGARFSTEDNCTLSRTHNSPRGGHNHGGHTHF